MKNSFQEIRSAHQLLVMARIRIESSSVRIHTIQPIEYEEKEFLFDCHDGEKGIRKRLNRQKISYHFQMERTSNSSSVY